MARTSTGRSRGRPKAPIDLALVEKLAGIQCTEEEIAAVLEIHPETFRRRKRQEPEIAEALERGRSKGRVSLRRAQWKAAEGGNSTMLVWLGKQYLGQRDEPPIGEEGRGGAIAQLMERLREEEDQDGDDAEPPAG